jgi:transposase
LEKQPTNPNKEKAMTQSAPQKTILLMAMELSQSTWKLGFGTGIEVRRMKDIPARDLSGLRREVEAAKMKLNLPPDTSVVACYEAGRDGHWIKRALEVHFNIQCKMVDSASIEVSRRKRNPKTDKIDVKALLKLLARDVVFGEKDTWRECRLPTEEQEEARLPHRELERLKKESSAHRSRIKSLLALHGIETELRANWGEKIEELRDYKKERLRQYTVNQLKREWARLQLAQQQMKEIEKEQDAFEKAKIAEATEKKIPLRKLAPEVDKIMQLRQLKGIDASARELVYEFLWRKFRNGRDVGAAAGLAPTPYRSGTKTAEQGISKLGSRRIRGLMVELSWFWVRYQSQSKISKWFREKFGGVGKRGRRTGIVAVARKLLVALWRYVETGVIPEGALLKNE